MTSQELASLLIQQSTPAPHQIRLDDQTLGTTGLNALITGNLGRKDCTLIMTADPTTIPPNPPASGFTLSATVPSGPDGFLSLDGRDASIEFLVGSTINLVLTVNTRESDGNPV